VSSIPSWPSFRLEPSLSSSQTSRDRPDYKDLRARYQEVLGAHQRILRDACGHHGGTEIDTQGDSFFFVFRRALDAVTAAAAAQQALAEHEWPQSGQVRAATGAGKRLSATLRLTCASGAQPSFPFTLIYSVADDTLVDMAGVVWSRLKAPQN
jgi:hypothetical protein